MNLGTECIWEMKWGEKDSNLRSLATTELQSVPFGHSGIPPFTIKHSIPILEN